MGSQLPKAPPSQRQQPLLWPVKPAPAASGPPAKSSTALTRSPGRLGVPPARSGHQGRSAAAETTEQGAAGSKGDIRELKDLQPSGDGRLGPGAGRDDARTATRVQAAPSL